MASFNPHCLCYVVVASRFPRHIIQLGGKTGRSECSLGGETTDLGLESAICLWMGIMSANMGNGWGLHRVWHVDGLIHSIGVLTFTWIQNGALVEK